MMMMPAAPTTTNITTTTTTTTTTNLRASTSADAHMANTATRNMNDSQDDNTNDSQDDNTPAESLTSSLQSDQIMLITKPFQWQGRSASSLNGVSSSLQSSSSHRGASNTRKRTNYMERHHQEVETSIEKFMRVALVLNLFQGSLEKGQN